MVNGFKPLSILAKSFMADIVSDILSTADILTTYKKQQIFYYHIKKGKSEILSTLCRVSKRFTYNQIFYVYD